MPYAWTKPETAPEHSGAVWLLTIRPFRSLPRRGFALFIAVTALALALPLLAVLGTVVLWGLLPFFLATLWAVWAALGHSYRTGQLTEELRLGPEQITLAHRAPERQPQLWAANPYWVRARLIAGGPVPDYLVLEGGPRPVELGRCLTPEERRAVQRELSEKLAALRDASQEGPCPSPVPGSPRDI